jgi:hypothetical protein
MRDKNEQLAWAGGLYDGEGSISCTSNNGNKHTRIQLSLGQKNDKNNKIAEVLIKFKKAIGFGNIYKKSKTGYEINQHQYLICDYKKVLKAIKILWPYISRVKRKQIVKNLRLYINGQEALKEKIEQSSIKRKEINDIKFKVLKKCLNCERIFKSYKWENRKYCSLQCYWNHSKKQI